MVFAFGGKNGSPVFKSSSLSLTWVSCFPTMAARSQANQPGFVYFASYTYFTSTYFPWLPNSGKCAGEEFAAFSGMAIISSYLVLFISFYIATYKKTQTAKSGRPRRNTGKQSLIDMKDYQVPSISNANGNGQSKSNGAVSTGRSNGPVTRSRKA